MQRIRRASLILLMLCSICAVFVVQVVPAMAVMPDGPNGPNGPGGEFCGGDTGFPCPTPANPAPAAQQESQLRKLGFQRGLAAGKNSDGTYQDCPEADKMSDFCLGWKDGYEEGLKQRGAGQVPGRKDIPPVAAAPVPVQPVNDGIPPILKALGIIVVGVLVIGVIVYGVGVMLAAAAGGGAGTGAAILARFSGAAKVVSRFLKKP